MNSVKDISRLHFISSDVDAIRSALEAGVDWIQLRMKDTPYQDMRNCGLSVWQLCDDYGATLMVNDHVELAVEIKAHGVHLGKKDMLPSKAREIMGDEFIIGGTSNTLEDMVWCNNEGCDYIGLGPYKFTNTKRELAPIIGECHIVDLIEAYQTKVLEGIPAVAIGGVEPNDVRPLMQMGYHGVAVSSGIGNALDVSSAASNYITEVKNGVVKYCG